MPLVEIWSYEFVDKLVEREAFIDLMWIEYTQLEDEFLFEIFLCSRGVRIARKLSCFSGIEKEGLKWRATGLDAAMSFFFLHLVRVRESGTPIVSLFRLCRSSFIACRL